MVSACGFRDWTQFAKHFPHLHGYSPGAHSTCDACAAPANARSSLRPCAAGSRRPRCADLGSSADGEIGDTDTGVADTLPSHMSCWQLQGGKSAVRCDRGL